MSAIFSKALTVLTPVAGVGLLAQISTGELPSNWLQLGVSGGCLFVLLAQIFVHQKTMREMLQAHKDTTGKFDALVRDILGMKGGK